MCAADPNGVVGSGAQSSVVRGLGSGLGLYFLRDATEAGKYR